MFWFRLRKKLFYDPDRCEKIISKYTGDRHMQVLRALVAQELNPSDIKNYYISGHTNGFPNEQYKLINRLDHEFYTIKRFESGSNHSLLRDNELIITDGIGTIVEHWECV
jgi:hypothetical protein